MVEATNEFDQVSRQKLRLLALAKPLAIVAVVVVIECVAVAMLLPTAADTKRLGQELAAARVTGGDAARPEAPGDRSAAAHDLREVDLGAYHIAVFQPSSNTTLRIDLHLYGTVLAKDLREFDRLYGLNKHRLGEQVHSTFRAAETADLTDAGLGLIKRQILEKSNRTLGRPLLQDVVFSQFNFLEQ